MLTQYLGVQITGLQGTATEQDRPGAAIPPADAGCTTLNAIRCLTPRQREVLTVMLQGKSNKGICRILNLAEPTVKNHVTAILRALGVTSRTEAVIKVTRASVLATTYRSPANAYFGYVPVAAPMRFR